MILSRVTPDALPIVTGTVQALDNQWLPRRMLRRMLETGESLADVTAEREEVVKGEFIRALVNLDAVVVNRASLLNDAVLNGYCQPEHPEQEEFRTLFEQGTVIPFLFKEDSPVIASSSYSMEEKNKLAWNQLCSDAKALFCLRLSWDDKENASLVHNRIARGFHERVIALASLPDHGALATEMGLPSGAGDALRRHLYDVGDRCARTFAETGRYGTRSTVYDSFLVAGGKDAHLGRYNSANPLAPAVKECVDLIYNTNLPDAIGRYPLTPADSANRMVLQEIDSAMAQTAIEPQQVNTLLRNAVFSLAQDQLCLDGYAKLPIVDVLALRQGEEWGQYMGAMRRVTQNPTLFNTPEELQAIYDGYAAVARAATNRMIGNRREAWAKKWCPAVKIALDIGGRTAIEMFYRTDGIWYSISELASEFIAEKSAPFVARMVIAGSDALSGGPKEQADFDTSLVLWTGKMHHAKKQFGEIMARIKENPRFNDSRKDTAPHGSPGMDQQG